MVDKASSGNNLNLNQHNGTTAPNNSALTNNNLNVNLFNTTNVVQHGSVYFGKTLANSEAFDAVISKPTQVTFEEVEAFTLGDKEVKNINNNLSVPKKDEGNLTINTENDKSSFADCIGSAHEYPNILGATSGKVTFEEAGILTLGNKEATTNNNLSVPKKDEGNLTINTENDKSSFSDYIGSTDEYLNILGAKPIQVEHKSSGEHEAPKTSNCNSSAARSEEYFGNNDTHEILDGITFSSPSEFDIIISNINSNNDDQMEFDYNI